MAKTVIAITGENANGILECQSDRFLDVLRKQGLQGRLLRLGSPDIGAELTSALQENVMFAWGYAGVGARLTINGKSVWTSTETPFISVLADAPYMMPPNHHVASPYVVNGYIYREWLDLQQQYFRSPQISALLPMGVLPSPTRAVRPWSKRTRRMVFVKTGADPHAQRRSWTNWPHQLRTVLNEAADALAAQDPGPIAPTVQACLAAHSLILDRNKPVLFGLLHELDAYIRALRATTVARALLSLPVDIIGAGWGHLQDEPRRARFLPATPASTLEDLYADTQILVNVTPNLASGAHERVLRGFSAGCCITSDGNHHAATTFHNRNVYHPFAWHGADLPDQLADSYSNQYATDEELDEARAYVEQKYDPMNFLSSMIQLAEVARMRSVFAGYSFEAAA